MKPLPAPQPGGKVKDLRRFLNVDDEDDFYLMVAWVLIALRPDGPYPILILTGEQGSAKSTTARMLRQLVDPNAVDIRSVPRVERDLVAAARNSHVIVLDNLSDNRKKFCSDRCRADYHRATRRYGELAVEEGRATVAGLKALVRRIRHGSL